MLGKNLLVPAKNELQDMNEFFSQFSFDINLVYLVNVAFWRMNGYNSINIFNECI
jgi:hypothetical protein